MKDKKILALDLGTKTGWALLKSNKVTSGTKNFATKRHEGGGVLYLRFAGFIAPLIADVDLVVYEEVRRHAGTTAAHVYGGLQATLTKLCEEMQVPYMSVPVGTVKKHATGKGNANKQLMIKAAQERGFSPVDDNEADALAILHYSTECI